MLFLYFTFFQMNHIIIAMNSRGYGFERHISGTQITGAMVHTIVIPGGKLEALIAAVHSKLNSFHANSKINIVLAGGICNLTKLSIPLAQKSCTSMMIKKYRPSSEILNFYI